MASSSLGGALLRPVMAAVKSLVAFAIISAGVTVGVVIE